MIVGDFFVSVPVTLFHAITEEESKATESVIEEVLRPFFSPRPNDRLDLVVLSPLVVKAADGWREDALRFVKGEGVTNQGRVRSDNIASKQFHGLLFRSRPEITLFSALTKAGLAAAPLPVFVRIGKSYNRIEPDFVIVR